MTASELKGGKYPCRVLGLPPFAAAGKTAEKHCFRIYHSEIIFAEAVSLPAVKRSREICGLSEI